MFKKGHHIGRPKGSKDKRYLDLQYWFNLLEKELEKKIFVTETTKSGQLIRTYQTDAVDPNKRAQLFLDAMKMLVSKSKSLPGSPTESKTNADEAMKLMRELEGNGLVKPLESSTEESKDKLIETKLSEINVNNVKDGIAIPKSDGSEEAKAVLERHDITVSNPQTKSDINIDPNAIS